MWDGSTIHVYTPTRTLQSPICQSDRQGQNVYRSFRIKQMRFRITFNMQNAAWNSKLFRGRWWCIRGEVPRSFATLSGAIHP